MKFSVASKEIKLKPLNLNDIIEFEETTKISLSSFSSTDFPISAIRELIYIAVKRENAEVTKEQIGECFVGAKGFERMGEIQNFLLGGVQEVNPTISD
jgi:hypothetical protein